MTKTITIVDKPWAYAIEHPVGYDPTELTLEDCRQDSQLRVVTEEELGEDFSS